MRKEHITKRVVEHYAKLPAPEREYVVWDKSLPGFGLRVRKESGHKTFVAVYRHGGRVRRVTLGMVGRITPDQARRLAQQTLAQVCQGVDPAALKAAERATPTINTLADTFMRDHVEAKRKASTANDYRYILNKIIKPAIGTEKADKHSRAAV